MLECADFFKILADAGVDYYAGVPDSLLKDFCAYVTDNAPSERHVITSNEGSAIGLAAGYYFASGRPACVYLQNSGLGNTVNPLTSLADPAVYGVPVLLVIGWRGEPGKKDEPQHIKMGGVTRELLDAIGVKWAVLPDNPEEAAALVAKATETMANDQAPFALIVPKGTFGKHALKAVDDADYGMSREHAIEWISSRFGAEALVVATTGKPSRELYEARERRGEPHATDFLTVGAMGHASQIALGVAGQRADRTVFCLDGDGAVIMHMGGLATIGQSGCTNFKHIVVNNGAHDSVGGQPTVAFDIAITDIAAACGYAATWVATTEAELAAAWDAFVSTAGPVMLEVRVKKGARADLGRPGMKPPELKEAFMGAING